MKTALMIFMAIMTLFVVFGKLIPMEKIRPYIFNTFQNKFAHILFNTLGAILVTASIVYLLVLLFGLFKISEYFILPILIIITIISFIKEKK